jgi:hypothetical protein
LRSSALLALVFPSRSAPISRYSDIGTVVLLTALPDGFAEEWIGDPPQAGVNICPTPVDFHRPDRLSSGRRDHAEAEAVDHDWSTISSWKAATRALDALHRVEADTERAKFEASTERTRADALAAALAAERARSEEAAAAAVAAERARADEVAAAERARADEAAAALAAAQARADEVAAALAAERARADEVAAAAAAERARLLERLRQAGIAPE